MQSRIQELVRRHGACALLVGHAGEYFLDESPPAEEPYVCWAAAGGEEEILARFSSIEEAESAARRLAVETGVMLL